LLGPPAPSSFQGLVTALINDLAADQALLVLDDYHLISAQQVHESLSFLVEHRPAGICVVLASRSDPPLPLARLRARTVSRHPAPAAWVTDRLRASVAEGCRWLVADPFPQARVGVPV
jgi:hypothetical protein